MTPGEIAEYLDEPRTLNVATVGSDGALHIVAVWFVMRGTRAVFWTYASSQKVRNLERDPRMSGLVESGDSYAELRGVELIGTGHLLTDQAIVLHVGRRLSAKYPQGGHPADLTKAAAKRVAIELRPERTVSWDHRKLSA
jgi:PPOX class probable F420-dependent enzyme